MRYYLIIDSNPKTIEFIQKAFCALSDYSCVGVSDGFSLKESKSLKFAPEIVLINFDTIRSSPFKAIELINKIIGIPPKYIALTTCFQKAFTAYKKGVIDVVNKMEKPTEIEKVIWRYHATYTPIKLFCIHYYYKYQYLHLDNILFLKADNYTTDFHQRDGTVINGFDTLKDTHSQLPYNFQRIHRSYVINSHYVKRIDYGKKEIMLHFFEKAIPFSKTYIDSIAVVKRILTEPQNPHFGLKSIY